MSEKPPQPPLAQDEKRVAKTRWIVGILVGVGVLAGSYLAAVQTVFGQQLENAALRGADQGSVEEIATSSAALSEVTIYALGVAAVLIAVVALLQKRVDLAIAGVAVIVLGQVITQGLKRFILPRPPLVEVIGDYAHNSFPSGHTTIAMTVLFAALIVFPYRWRGTAMLIMLPWAWGLGAYTITAKWHRFSDTLGADAVALICACLATWWLVRRREVVKYEGRRHVGRIVIVVVFSAMTAATLIIGTFLWGSLVAQGVDLSQPDQNSDYVAYLGANSLAAAFSGLTVLTFWGLWHRIHVGARVIQAPVGLSKKSRQQGSLSSAG